MKPDLYSRDVLVAMFFVGLIGAFSLGDTSAPFTLFTASLRLTFAIAVSVVSWCYVKFTHAVLSYDEK